MVGTTARQRNDYKDGNGNIVVNSHFRVITEIGKINVRPADGHELKFGFINYEADYDNGLPNAAHTASVYATEVTNQIATARWRYNRPDDRLFDFDLNTYWTKNQDGPDQDRRLQQCDHRRARVARARSRSRPSGSTRTTRRAGNQGRGAPRSRSAAMPSATRSPWSIRAAPAISSRPTGERTVSGAFAQLQDELYALDRAHHRRPLRQLSPGRRQRRRRQQRRPGLAQGHARHHADPVVHASTAPMPKATGAGDHRSLRQRCASVRRRRSRCCRTSPSGRKSARPRKSASTSSTTACSLRTTRCASRSTSIQNDVTDFIEQTGAGETVSRGRVVVTCTTPIFGCIQYQNIPSARIRGAEFEGNYDAGDWFLGRRGEHPEGRGPHQESAAGENLSGAGRDHGRRALLGTQGDGRRCAGSRSPQRSERHPAAVSQDLRCPPTPTASSISISTIGRTKTQFWRFGIDNLFDQYYVKYLDLRTPGVEQPHTVTEPRHHVQGFVEGTLRGHILQKRMTGSA